MNPLLASLLAPVVAAAAAFSIPTALPIQAVHTNLPTNVCNPTMTPQQKTELENRIANEVTALANNYRTSNTNLKALTPNKDLADAAHAWGKTVSKTGNLTVSDDFPGGGFRGEAAYFTSIMSSAQDTFNAWTSNASYTNYLKNPNFNFTGVGVVFNDYCQAYLFQNFATTPGKTSTQPTTSVKPTDPTVTVSTVTVTPTTAPSTTKSPEPTSTTKTTEPTIVTVPVTTVTQPVTTVTAPVTTVTQPPVVIPQPFSFSG